MQSYVLPVLKEGATGKPGSATLGVLSSEDHGTTFQENGIGAGGEEALAWHTSMVKLKNGDLLQYMALVDETHLRVSKSTDGGR